MSDNRSSDIASAKLARETEGPNFKLTAREAAETLHEHMINKTGSSPHRTAIMLESLRLTTTTLSRDHRCFQGWTRCGSRHSYCPAQAQALDPCFPVRVGYSRGDERYRKVSIS